MNTSKRNDWIPISEMITGRLYDCDARNFTEGRWTGEEFTYLRSKFGTRFEDTEYHYDRGAPHGTAKPYTLIEE
jgi:hypothetical protein